VDFLQYSNLRDWVATHPEFARISWIYVMLFHVLAIPAPGYHMSRFEN